MMLRPSYLNMNWAFSFLIITLLILLAYAYVIIMHLYVGAYFARWIAVALIETSKSRPVTYPRVR